MMVQLQRILGLLPEVHELGVLVLYYMIILTVVSGTYASNTTVVPATSLLPSTNNSQVDITPTPLETKVIEEVITNLVTEIYSEIPVESPAAEIFDQVLTTQLSETDIYETTQITSLSTTLLVDDPEETQTTVSSLPKIFFTRGQTISPTPVISQRTPSSLTTVAQIGSLTPDNGEQITTNPIITSEAATSTSFISTTKTETPTVPSSIPITTKPLTSNISTTLTSTITSRATTVTPSIITSTSITSKTSQSLVTNLTYTSSYDTSKGTTRSFGNPTSNVTTSSPINSTNTTTSFTTVPDTIASISPYKQTTELELLSSSTSQQSTSSAYSTSTESSFISNSTESNRTKPVGYRTTIYEHLKSSDVGEFVSSTTVLLEDTFPTTLTNVEDDTDLHVPDKDELPLLLIIISCTVAVLVTLLFLMFGLILCFARKRQQLRNAKYYDYKKRWVKRAPRPKYEKVKQNLRLDREAAGSGWVFQNGANPSKRITLELRPRNSQSAPEGTSNNRNSNPLNYESALSETFPPDLFSSPEVAADLDGSSIGSLGLSKGFDLADCSRRSSSSEGDSGILALGDDTWSPTKGVPFHFISDDAVIEL